MTVPNELIGLWRFQEVGEPRKWAATFNYQGKYYDNLGFSTMEEAVADVRRQLRRLKSGKT